MEESVLVFIYKDAIGKITARAVELAYETDQHLEGLCLTAMEHRTFRKDRILEVIENIDDVEESLQYHIDTNPPPKTIVKQRDLLDICFTGFKKKEKQKLIKSAKDFGFKIRKAVTDNLDILCCGYNAGPKKIEKAKSQGTLVLNEVQFHSIIETGEIPESQ
ncbi:MAG: hypothetical protein K8S18_03095 [Desulfobacula sp.]|nr:hypothetical protein [Desulfobacula sp.]